jgi:PhnB protein
MAKRSLNEQLDLAVEALLAHREPPRVSLSARLDPLLGLAADLRDLPRRQFHERLATELEEEATMPGREVNPIRDGFHTITPYIAVREAAEMIDFVKRAFGAEGGVLGTGSQGGIHAEVKIGDSMLMIGGGPQWQGTPMPTSLHYYVPDVDAVYRRAIEAGATSLAAPVDQPYDDREAAVKDVAGNVWYIATHRGPSHVREGLRAVTPFLHPRGAGGFIEFLKRAFSAEPVAIHEDRPGNIAHAIVRIGDSALEMGEAHGPWQPMPTMFNLYVPDSDALYRQAIAAGAESLAEPADLPYGYRVGAVKDPNGNLWYLATHIPAAQP